jgi:hypothetical protein
VNVREGNTDEERQRFNSQIDIRSGLFRTVSLVGLVRPPGMLHIENPYGGGHAAKFTHQLASLPKRGLRSLGRHPTN